VKNMTTWSAALQLVQPTHGKLAIVFRFGKKGDSLQTSRCTML
jgi:hypothetical protein